MRGSIVILLTGTIKVSNVPYLLLTDTALREREYYNSIKKWTALGYPVTFCENSNYHSEMINEVVASCTPGHFEYLKFNSLVSHLGKGRGEAEIIDYVLNNSSLINDHTMICKATGKNFVSNAKDILKTIAQSSHTENTIIAILLRNLTMADSRFFFFKKDFYVKYWIKHIREVDEHNRIYLEHTLAKSIHVAIAAGEKWSLPPDLPVIEGYVGTTGARYRNSVTRRFLNKFYFVIVNKFVTYGSKT